MVKYRPTLTDAPKDAESPSTATVNKALNRIHSILDALMGKSGETRLENGLAAKGPIYSQAIRQVYAADNILDTDYVVLLDTRNGAYTIRLPTASGRTGRTFILKFLSGTNALTIRPFGSETIDGAATVSVSVAYTITRVVSDGSNWWTV